MRSIAAALILSVIIGAGGFTVQAAHDKTRANSYDDTWENAWVTHCRGVYRTSGKTAGFVLQIGDSITFSNPYSQWPRYGSGQTAEDTALVTWCQGTSWNSGNYGDYTNKNGFFLAAADTSVQRGMTASSGISAGEYVAGDGNTGTAMPSDTNTATAQTKVADGATYVGNLQIETVAAAFADAQFAVVMLGTNDVTAGRTAAAFIADLTTIVDTLEGRNIVVVLSTIPPYHDSAKNTLVNDYNTAIRNFAQTRGLPLVDFNQEILERRPGTSWNGTLLTLDDVHPTASGGAYDSASDPYASGGDPATHTTGDACLSVGYLLRSWLTIQKLKEVKLYVADNVDPPASQPTVAFAASSSSGGEATTTVRLSVTLSAASAQTVSVNYAVTGGTATGGGVDYTLAGGTLTFNPGVTSQDVVVTVVNDTLDEADETVEVTLSLPVNATLGANTKHTYTIADDDPAPAVAFNAASSSISEASATAALTVALSAPSGRTVSVAFAVTGGTAAGGGVDYTLANGTLTFAPGEVSKNIGVSIVNDTLVEPAETVEVSLSSPTNATLGPTARHTLTIADNDTPPPPVAPPALVSGPTATPDPVLAGQAATFTVSFSSTSTLTYTWDFGDGIVAAGGSTNWRIYTSPGSYLLKVTATDTAGQSATASAIITVVVAGSAGPTAADSDGDGSADADELAVGTNPHDPNSKPGGSADCDGDGLTDDKDPDADGDGVSTANEIAMGTDPFNAASFVKLPMTVAKLQAKAVFGVTGRDSITVAGVIPGLAAGLDPAGQQAVLKVRGVTAPFTLGPTGRAKSSQGSFQLKLKGKRDRTTKRLVFIGGNAPFTAVLKGGTFADLLGMDQAADASAQAASIAVDVQVFGYVFTDAPNALYSAKAGKGGKFKK